MLAQILGKLVFKLNGWHYEVNPEAISDPKQVMIGFPHTTNFDGIRGIALFKILDLNYHLFVKQELFRFPLGPLLTSLGCIPVDRTKSKNIVQQAVEEFSKNERFSLIVAPEATRTKSGEKPPMRTGFWHIAKAANVPIVLMLSDSSLKMGRIFAKIMPSESMENDLLEIQRLYAEYGINVILPEKSIE
ncbi:MAG: 1-acyl-sn-glycerol-3-phosphate acyltransferase [Gammaproteobacteria bacterium]|nr:1-acyl-sn-glycerol-3-phosphate acyltransferase [Gammaproteobacteria bacterium]